MSTLMWCLMQKYEVERQAAIKRALQSMTGCQGLILRSGKCKLNVSSALIMQPLIHSFSDESVIDF